MRKISKFISTLALSLLMGIGVFSAASIGSKNVGKTEAIVPSSGKYAYLELNGVDWLKDGASIVVWDGYNDCSTTAVNVYYNNTSTYTVYRAQINANASDIYWKRVKGTSKWNEAKATYNDTNIFQLTSFDACKNKDNIIVYFDKETSTGGDVSLTSNGTDMFGKEFETSMSVTLKAKKDTGYNFVCYQLGGTDTSITQEEYDFNNSHRISDNFGWYGQVKGKFSIKKTNVTLDPKGGSGGTSSVNATYGAAMPSATMPTKTGYTFNGYYDKETSGTQYYTNAGASAKNWDKEGENATLYAQWTAHNYTIQFDSNGGTGSFASITKTYGTSYKLNKASMTKSGYVFKGWNDQNDGKGSHTVENEGTIDFDLSTTQGATKTLYALWGPGEGSFVAGKDLGGWSKSSSVRIPLQSGTEEGEFVAEHVPFTTTTGDDIGFKATWASGGIDYFQNIASLTYYDSPSGRNLKQASVPGGRSGSFESTGNVIPSYNDGTKEVLVPGYYTVKVYNAGNETKHYSAILEEYKIDYIMKGHGTAPTTEPVGYLEKFTKPDNPKCEGFTFDGWYTDNTYSAEFDFTAPVESNKTAYAKWTAEDYETTITLNPNGGSGGSTEVTATFDQEMPEITIPSRTNHTFLGYFDDTLDTPKQYYNQDGSSACNWDRTDEEYTLTAHWSVDQGVYLDGSFASWAQNFQYKMTLNDAEDAPDNEYYIKGITLEAGAKIKCYNEAKEYIDVKQVLSSHPLYPVEIDDKGNCFIKEGGKYDIYFNTSGSGVNEHKFYIEKVGEPINGFSFTIHDKTTYDTVTYHHATEFDGTQGKEYKATFDCQSGEYLKAYYQGIDDDGNPIFNEYFITMFESVKNWKFEENKGLLCPFSGTYSFYLIDVSPTKEGKYEKVSIYLEGESDALEFADSFNETLCAICQMDGSTSFVELSNAWNTLSETYTGMEGKFADATKFLLRTATNKDSDETMKFFADLYDYIAKKYNSRLGENYNFANRDLSPNTNTTNGRVHSFFTEVTEVISSGPGLAILISTIAVVTVAGTFFILKKKKED